MVSSHFWLIVFLAQVFPHVLPLCEPGLCCSDPAANAQLETTLQILPLVGDKLDSLASILSLCIYFQTMKEEDIKSLGGYFVGLKNFKTF